MGRFSRIMFELFLDFSVKGFETEREATRVVDGEKLIILKRYQA